MSGSSPESLPEACWPYHDPAEPEEYVDPYPYRTCSFSTNSARPQDGGLPISLTLPAVCSPSCVLVIGCWRGKDFMLTSTKINRTDGLTMCFRVQFHARTLLLLLFSKWKERILSCVHHVLTCHFLKFTSSLVPSSFTVSSCCLLASSTFHHYCSSEAIIRSLHGTTTYGGTAVQGTDLEYRHYHVSCSLK